MGPTGAGSRGGLSGSGGSSERESRRADGDIGRALCGRHAASAEADSAPADANLGGVCTGNDAWSGGNGPLGMDAHCRGGWNPRMACLATGEITFHGSSFSQES